MVLRASGSIESRGMDAPIEQTAPKAEPRKRFQFQLIDAVIYSFYVGALLWPVPFIEFRQYGMKVPGEVIGVLILAALIPVAFVMDPIRENSHSRWRWALIALVLFAILNSFIVTSISAKAFLARAGIAADRAYRRCKDYATAQDTYIRTDWNKDGVFEYAPSLAELHARGLINADFAAAEGPDGVPYDGFLYKCLWAQGKNAPGGAKSYVINGYRTLGYAFIAVPVFRPFTDSLTTSSSGTVYGHSSDYSDGRSFLKSINEFDPSGWHTDPN